MIFLKSKNFQLFVGLTTLLFLSACGSPSTSTSNADAPTASNSTVSPTASKNNDPTNVPQVSSQEPVFMEIARNADGSVKLIPQDEAAKYCLEQGGRLPSAREFAHLVMSFGARGIVEDCGSDSNCYQVRARMLDGSLDQFYFSNAGYQQPTGDLWSYWFWSSSIRQYVDNEVYVLSLNSGNLLYAKRGLFLNGAVRCVSVRARHISVTGR